ncbi:TonB-dependent receptor domain-containing protein [Aquirufa aurantiipilula]|uniref:TonB-dependent receptor n=1 Tax=Aquirufa aurantiipilula TaxID=2696561 RepID=A0ABT6BK72_9BACT|nr:TonB-dependent receptor [Aquirufa aurantiipilula]MDF5690769.1 TonB-dependent receptor [Aquirufa aurantiipilula]
MPNKSAFLFLLLCSITLSVKSQVSQVTLSGVLKDQGNGSAVVYSNVLLKKAKDSTFVQGTISDANGRFRLNNIKPGTYYLQISMVGYQVKMQHIFVGSLTEFLDLATIDLVPDQQQLQEVIVRAKRDEIENKLDKKSYSVETISSQTGGSVLQVMQSLPGITVQDGKLNLRGSSQVAVLVDGKQTALTGFGAQSGLDNIPSSAIEKIEIINNPSAKYDANGNAGIINIIFKKTKQEGFNGKIGLSAGLGALGIKRENLPSIRPQFQATPKLNPSLSLNYRKKNVNAFMQADFNHTPTLNKNEFVTRTYDAGEVIQQQTKRNRRTNIGTFMGGIDWKMNDQNSWSSSILFSSEKILDDGDEPFFNQNLTERRRLWQFLEDELKTTVTSMNNFQHRFEQPGHLINVGLNYTWHQEDEKYFFTNIYPTYTGLDAFKLMSDEHVTDLNVDYVKPLKWGRVEAGLKYRYRFIPTSMLFIPGLNSPLDVTAGGWADYKETIPAIYSNYIFENEKYEVEAGLRMEYVTVKYDIDPNHNTYKSDGYQYVQPFPNIRLGYKLNENNKLSFFFSRRVDRPAELDIRVFPKYDDAEIVKVGNPALKPQFTNTMEIAYKSSIKRGYLYTAIYQRLADATITRIATTVPGNTLIYHIMQNAGKSSNLGMEMVLSQELSKAFSFNLNLNVYQNRINSFSVFNQYPIPTTYTSSPDEIISGSAKWIGFVHLPNQWNVQFSAIYLAPDLIPQGRIGQRFSLDVGIKKAQKNGRGEYFINASDLLNTMVIHKDILAKGFRMSSSDYYETQVIRAGYQLKF